MVRLTLAILTILTSLGGCRGSLPAKPIDNAKSADASHLATLSVEVLNDAAIRDELGESLTGYRFLIQPMEGTICATSTKVDRVGPYDSMDLEEPTIPGCDYYVGIEFGTLAEDGKSLQLVVFSNWDSFDTRFSLFTGDLKAGKELLLQMELPRAKGGVTTTPNSGEALKDKRREIIALYSNTVAPFEDSQASFDKYGSILQSVSPYWYDVKADGTVAAANGGLKKAVLDTAKAKGVRIVPLFVTLDAEAPVLATDTSRLAAVDAIAKTAVDNGFHGVSVVFTFLMPDQRANLTAFIDALSTRLRADKKLLYLSVYPKVDLPEIVNGVYDYAALYAKVDRMNIMLQDKAYTATAPGSVAPMPWVEANVCYFTRTAAETPCGGLGLNPNKILLSVPTYGYVWPTAGGAGVKVTEREAFDFGTRYNPDPTQAPPYIFDDAAQTPYYVFTRDATNYTMHFETSYSASFKFRLVETYNLKGITMNQMGGETERWWRQADCIMKITGNTRCQ